MSRVRMSWTAVVCMMLMAGCAGESESTSTMPATFSDVIVTTSYDPEASFSKEGSFAFLVYQAELDPALGIDYAAVDNRIREAIQKELTRKGFKYGITENLRYHVTYEVVVEPQYEQKIINPFDEDWMTVLELKDYAKGALVVKFRNADSPKPIWAGIFNGSTLLGKVSEQEKEERVAFAIGELLKSFPPK